MNFDFGFKKRDFILIVLAWCLVGFVIGWLFPVEGPYDEKYEELTTPTKKRSSTVNVAAPVRVKRFIIDMELEDWMNEEEEEYYFIPFTKEE